MHIFDTVSPQLKANMIARQVRNGLKASCTAQITRTIKNEVIPLLRNRKGSRRNHVRRPRRNGAIGITLWDHKETPQPITAPTICRCWNFWRE